MFIPWITETATVNYFPHIKLYEPHTFILHSVMLTCCAVCWWQESVRLVCPSCTWGGTDTMGISCTRVTQAATTAAGRPPALATTALWVKNKTLTQSPHNYRECSDLTQRMSSNCNLSICRANVSVFALPGSGVIAEAGLQRGRDQSGLSSGALHQSPQQNTRHQQTHTRQR